MSDRAGYTMERATQPGVDAAAVPTRFKALPMAEVIAQPPRSHLVAGIVGAGEFAVIYGPPKSGKSFLALDLAHAVAAKRLWHGRAVTGGPVLYVAAEGRGGLPKRLAALQQRYGQAANLYLMLERADLFGAPEHVSAIASLAAELGAVLIVLDTVARLTHGMDENSARDMAVLVAAVETIQAATDAAVVAVHHGAKSGDRGPRGSGALAGAADAVIRVERGAGGVRTAEFELAKDDADGARINFTLEAVETERGLSCVVVPADPGAGGKSGRRLTETQAAWHRDLCDLFNEPDAAQERVPVSGMKPTLTLTREQVRQGLRRKGRFGDVREGDPLTDKDRSRLHSALNSLKDRGKIGVTDELVWLT